MRRHIIKTGRKIKLYRTLTARLWLYFLNVQDLYYKMRVHYHRHLLVLATIAVQRCHADSVAHEWYSAVAARSIKQRERITQELPLPKRAAWLVERAADAADHVHEIRCSIFVAWRMFRYRIDKIYMPIFRDIHEWHRYVVKTILRKQLPLSFEKWYAAKLEQEGAQQNGISQD